MASTRLRAIPRSSDARRGVGSKASAVRQYEQDQRKRSFLRMVSHELRTPLNSIIGFSDIIASELYGAIGDDRYRQHAELVRESGLRLLKLVNQVMEIARLEADAADLDIHPEALRPLVEDAVTPFAHEADRREIAITYDVAPDMPLVMTDSRALKTIVANLMQNAITASPDGGEITIVLHHRAGSVAVEIRDQGAGVDPRHLPRLMRPFEQGEGPLTRRSEGAGLGLPIVRLLCKAMGGAVRLQSSPGHGLTAIVRLPAAEVPATKTGHAA